MKHPNKTLSLYPIYQIEITADKKQTHNPDFFFDLFYNGWELLAVW